MRNSHVRNVWEQKSLFAQLSAGKSGAYPPAPLDQQRLLRLDANELDRFAEKQRGRERHSGPPSRGRQRPRHAQLR